MLSARKAGSGAAAGVRGADVDEPFVVEVGEDRVRVGGFRDLVEDAVLPVPVGVVAGRAADLDDRSGSGAGGPIAPGDARIDEAVLRHREVR
jgi:hypothetical protein